MIEYFFRFCSFYVLNYMAWFQNVKPILQSWDKLYLVMMYFLFYISYNWIFSNFIKDVFSPVTRDIGL